MEVLYFEKKCLRQRIWRIVQLALGGRRRGHTCTGGFVGGLEWPVMSRPLGLVPLFALPTGGTWHQLSPINIIPPFG